MSFVNTKGIQAIKDGMVYSMPLLIVGSVFLIITNFPVPAVVNMLEQTGIKAVLEQANGATFNISAIIAVLGIAYNYIKLDGQEPLSGAIVAFGVFIMMTPASIVTEGGDVVGGIIDKSWTAGKGILGAGSRCCHCNRSNHCPRNLFHGIPHDGYGRDLQCDSDASPEHDGFYWRSSPDVFPDPVFMVLRRAWFNDCRRNYDWYSSGKRSGKPGFD